MTVGRLSDVVWYDLSVTLPPNSTYMHNVNFSDRPTREEVLRYYPTAYEDFKTHHMDEEGRRNDDHHLEYLDSVADTVYPN